MNRNASAPAVFGVDVLVARWVVKLLFEGLDEAIGIRLFAVVDLRAFHLNAGRRNRRNVFDKELRQSFLADLVDRAQTKAVAVGIGQVLIDPDAARQPLGREFARRKAHLARLAIDQIAVVIDVNEIVVGTDNLELAVGAQQRAVVPQANVL